MQQNKDQKDFGKGCRKEVAEYESQASQDYRLNFRLQKECKKDIEALCKDSCPGKSSEVRGNKVGEAVTALLIHTKQACMGIHTANRPASSCPAPGHILITCSMPWASLSMLSWACSIQDTTDLPPEALCCMTGVPCSHGVGSGCQTMHSTKVATAVFLCCVLLGVWRDGAALLD